MAGKFELRYHNAMPTRAKILGLDIRIVPECEGGGFSLPKDIAELFATAPELQADNARLRARVAVLDEALDAIVRIRANAALAQEPG